MVEVVAVVAAVVSEGFLDGVVVDDEVFAAFGFSYPPGFSGAWWALDEDDAGFVGAPFVFVAVVGAFVVAVGAGGSEVGGFPPLAAVCDGGDVVDLGGGGGAAG